MIKCPHCGGRLEIVRSPLTQGQRDILSAIERLKRNFGRLPAAPAIAVEVERPLTTIKLELQILQSEKYVYRPNGEKSGWDVCGDGDIALIPFKSSRAT